MFAQKTKDTEVSKKAEIGDRYNQVPHLTQDHTWKNDKNTQKHHVQESQEVSLFPAGDHKAAMNRQELTTDGFTSYSAK